MTRNLNFNVPFMFNPNTKASSVTPLNRICTFCFGSPNWRRANGIISSKFETETITRRIFNFVRKALNLRLVVRPFRRIPIYEVDRIGTLANEGLPRIWLSEIALNTKYDIKRRVFVECYPSSPDAKGKKALELAKRYLGEGNNSASGLLKAERIDCFRAAEILLKHAVMRGNREASMHLCDLYERDLCEGIYWDSYLNVRAKHARGKVAKRH